LNYITFYVTGGVAVLDWLGVLITTFLVLTSYCISLVSFAI